jgi:hypothetical protein
VHPKIYTVGVDLGQAQDPTAVVVVETEMQVRVWRDERGALRERPVGREHRVRHAERLPLAMSYVDQVACVMGLLRSPELPARDTEVVIDRTGVGAAVGDLFRSGGMDPVQVVITGGLDEQRDGARVFKVPKLLLVSRLQASLHAGELKFAVGLAEEQAFKAELAEFRMRHTDGGRLTFGAREGHHDDLVLGLAIALWRGQERSKGPDFVQAPLLGV